MNREEEEFLQLPNVPPLLRAQLTSGYGHAEISQDNADGPIIVMWGVSFEEMETMGAEERARLGLEAMYQRWLDHQPPETE